MDHWIPVLANESEAWSLLGLRASDWVAVTAGLGGAILGAIVAGAIAAWLQKKAAEHAHDLQVKAADHAARQAAISQKAIARENAVRLMMRASLIFVDISAKVDALHRQLDNANRAGLTGHPMWARVPGIVGGSQLQLFEVSELSPFLDAGEVAIVSRCVELGLQHEALIETITRYNQGRSLLKDIVSSEALAEGWIFAPENEALLLRLTPHTAELDSLISIFKERAEKQLERARELNIIIGETGTKLFGASFPRVSPKELGLTSSS